MHTNVSSIEALPFIIFLRKYMPQYEPELFPGLIYRMKSPKIVLLIFVSGKIVLTGAKLCIKSVVGVPGVQYLESPHVVEYGSFHGILVVVPKNKEGWGRVLKHLGDGHLRLLTLKGVPVLSTLITHAGFRKPVLEDPSTSAALPGPQEGMSIMGNQAPPLMQAVPM
eukprot:1575399-Pyramimonas_sp.AAC.1